MSSPVLHPWERTNPFFVGILAFLLPGLGHLYQGRVFKAAVYFGCIFGVFAAGMWMAEGVVVYKPNPERGAVMRVSLSFVAQFSVGAGSIPALIQSWRSRRPENKPLTEVDQALSVPFQGTLEAIGPGSESAGGELRGTVQLFSRADTAGRDVKGIFQGTLNGEPIELKLGGNLSLEQPVAGSPRRALRCHVIYEADNHPSLSQSIVGSIPRPFTDWLFAPPEPAQIQELTGRLGKTYELALVFTWIAGLLNVLAIWDAMQGPAYGLGNEVPSPAAPDAIGSGGATATGMNATGMNAGGKVATTASSAAPSLTPSRGVPAPGHA